MDQTAVAQFANWADQNNNKKTEQQQYGPAQFQKLLLDFLDVNFLWYEITSWNARSNFRFSRCKFFMIWNYFLKQNSPDTNETIWKS